MTYTYQCQGHCKKTYEIVHAKNEKPFLKCCDLPMKKTYKQQNERKRK